MRFKVADAALVDFDPIKKCDDAPLRFLGPFNMCPLAQDPIWFISKLFIIQSGEKQNKHEWGKLKANGRQLVLIFRDAKKG